MTHMLILSLPIRVQGYETLAHFQFVADSVWLRVCHSCGATRRPTLVPVDLPEDDPDSPETIGSALCRACSTAAAARWNASWPVMSSSETSAVWRMVTAERAHDAAQQAARERSVATTPNEMSQGCARALILAFREEISADFDREAGDVVEARQ